MKSLSVIAIVLITLVGGFLAWNWYGWHRMKTGYEVKAKDHAEYLRGRLAEDFGYGGFEAQWLEKAWMNGFQDHTYLFVVTADAGMREAIERATGTDPIQLRFFSSGNYLGPSIAPEWWDTARIDASESRYFEKNSDFWRFTWLDGRLYIVYCN